eukprot:jgi/Botrbrau1/7231/Bobra.0021s0016.1
MRRAEVQYRFQSQIRSLLLALFGAAAFLVLVTVGNLRIQDTWKPSIRSAPAQPVQADREREEPLPEEPAADTVQVDSPWDERVYNHSVCSNTCPHALNGVCNDGRSGAGRVLCDMGTDCSDCGAWSLQLPASRRAAPLWEPITYLRDRGIEVYVKDANTDHSFRMAYTNSSVDVDLSMQMDRFGWVEGGLTQMWGHVLQRGPAACIQAGRNRSLVLDVGGNFGWYTLYAATLGCRVRVWEPVPRFRAFLEYGLQLNNLMTLVDVRAAVVVAKAGQKYEVLAPQQGIWGTASIGGFNIDKTLGGGFPNEKVEVAGERLDAVVKEDVALLKIDVEGFEPDVFASASRIFKSYRVWNVVVEYSPGIYEKYKRWADYSVWPHMLLRLHELGFTLLHLSWPLATADFLGMVPGKGWGKTEFPPLPHIPATALLHDLRDAEALSIRSLNCPLPWELHARFKESWHKCNRVPQDVHPKSLRSEFTYNTNIFATADPSLFKLGRIVGVHSPNQTEDEWFGLSGIALGGLGCEHVPLKFKVMLRCPCTDLAVCGREAAIVESYARGGVWWKPWSRGSKLVG